MKIIEFLASQLDRETTPYDNQNTISEGIDFWNLCLECRKLLSDEKLAEEEKDVTNIN